MSRFAGASASKLAIAGAAAVAFLVSAAHAETLYLNCATISAPKYKLGDLYLKPPANRDQFYEDAFNAGFAAFIDEPPTTWVVQLDTGTITSPDKSRIYRVTGRTETTITGSFVSEGGNVFLWGLNRINGAVSVSNTPKSEDQREWKAAHGKLFPILWTWGQKCTASSRPAM